jgi:hypothetical protein
MRLIFFAGVFITILTGGVVALAAIGFYRAGESMAGLHEPGGAEK